MIHCSFLLCISILLSHFVEPPEDENSIRPPNPDPFLQSRSEESEKELKAIAKAVEIIKGKWEVISVERDGDHRHGEVGQEKGDVIRIEIEKDFSVLFS